MLSSIRDYIEARLGAGSSEVTPALDEMYASIVGTGTALFHAQFPSLRGISPHLQVIRTHRVLVETVRIGSQWHIIYDQTLGQVMTRLNALMMQGADVKSVDCYIAKIMAMRAFDLGDAARARDLAVIHTVWRASDGFHGRADQRRAAVSLAAEACVLMHELTHAFWTSSTEFATEISTDYLEMLEPFDKERALEEDERRRVAEAFATSIMNDFERVNGSTEPGNIEQFRADALKLGEKWVDSGTDPVPLPSELGRSPHLLEECCCDAWGTWAGVMVSQLLWDMELQDALAGAYLAIMHMRMMKYIDTLTTNGDHSGIILETTMRGRYIRYFMQIFYSITLTQSEDARRNMQNAIHEHIVRLNESHYAAVFDRLLLGGLPAILKTVTENAEFRSRIDKPKSLEDPHDQFVEIFSAL